MPRAAPREIDRKDKRVDAQLPTHLRSLAPIHSSETFGRKELADWLCHPDHPLVARVIVNRVWQHHFAGGWSALLITSVWGRKADASRTLGLAGSLVCSRGGLVSEEVASTHPDQQHVSDQVSWDRRIPWWPTLRIGLCPVPSPPSGS